MLRRLISLALVALLCTRRRRTSARPMAVAPDLLLGTLEPEEVIS